MFFSKDKMTIKRPTYTVDSNYENVITYVDVAVDIHCHLSIKDVKNLTSIDNQINVTESNFTIFCKSNIDVKEGDLIIIDDYRFKAAQPKLFKYLEKYEIGVSEWKE